ncbi:MAG: ABC transporter substrate-binding protein [Chloroflexi bacterium]|nr:ABC transporter substrate-binding protein [Chloroflexota bacterium]
MRRILFFAGFAFVLLLLLGVACRAAEPTPTPTRPAATPTPTTAVVQPTATPTTVVAQPTVTPTTAVAQPTATATAAPPPPTDAGTPIDTLVAQAKARGEGAIHPWVLDQIEKRKIPGRRPPLPTTPPKYGGTGGGGGYPAIQAFREVTTLDPFTNSNIANAAIVDNLVEVAVGPQYSATGSVVNPVAAQSWEYKDPTTLVLHLTRTAKFWNKPPVNGRPVTAQDWVWSFEKLRASSALAAVAAPFQPVTSFKALDDYTLEIKTARTYPALLLQLGYDSGFGVLPKELYEGGKRPATEADLVASGPFMIEKFTPGSEVRFKRNPDYWGYWSGVQDNKILETPTQYRLPFFDGVSWLQLKDEAAMDAGFRAQKIDMMGWGQSIRKPRYESLSKTNPDATWTISLSPSGRRAFLFRTDEPPFDNLKLRQAVSTAIDQNGMCDGPQAGWCVPGEYIYAGAAEWFLPTFEYGEGAKYSSYDAALAKKLLAEAGYKPGELTFTVNMAPTVPYTIAEVELFVANLKDIGINAKIVSRDVGAHRSILNAGNWHEVMYDFYSLGNDPDQWLRDPYHSKALGGTALHLNDPKLDAMVDAMSAELDHWARVKKVYEIIRYMAVQRYSTYPSGAYAYPYVAQPYVKNHMFNSSLGSFRWGFGVTRSWIDRENPNVGFRSL